MTKEIPLGVRPDLIDLAGAEYDVECSSMPQKTIIICSAPRTGSYELCRFLLAAEVGIPHEYFHPQFAQILAARWGLSSNPLDRSNIGIYLGLLRRNRSRNGVLAVNMQYWQFTEHLMNMSGVQLFNNAKLIHLFRPDVVTQVTSWRVAMNTGIWDFSGRQTSEPREYPETIEEQVKQFESDMKFVMGEDAGFRELFTLLDALPVFITTPELFRAPLDIVSGIARSLGIEPNIAALEEMIAGSKPYAQDTVARQKAYGDLADHLKRKAFAL